MREAKRQLCQRQIEVRLPDTRSRVPLHHTRSKTATAKLYWISANIETDGIAPATQMRGVVVSTEGGIVTLSGLKENERVTFYNISGIKLGETRAINGQASISATDDVIIARIGSQSIKVKR